MRFKSTCLWHARWTAVLWVADLAMLQALPHIEHLHAQQYCYVASLAPSAGSLRDIVAESSQGNMLPRAGSCSGSPSRNVSEAGIGVRMILFSNRSSRPLPVKSSTSLELML